MSNTTQMHQQTVPPRHGFKYAFQRSTWITTGWNWFLMLAGKAAEPVLTISVIYSCARLLPAIHLPVQVDNTIFICQMVALDIGGLGLRKLANQARKDSNEEGATLAGRVSTALLTIMGINVALSVLESIAPLDPTFTKVVEGMLLIARAIMAVFYAYVIHSLHGENDGDEPHSAPYPQPDIQQIIEQALAEQAERFDQRLQAITSEQSRMLDAIQQLQSAPVVDVEALQLETLQRASSIDGDALLQKVDALLNKKTTSVKQALEAEISGMKQQMQQVEAGVLHKVSDEVTCMQKSVEKTLAVTPRLAAIPKGVQPAKKATSLSGEASEAAPSNVLDFTQNLTRDAVIQLIEADKTLLQLSDRALAKRVGTTSSTAHRAKSDYGVKHPEALQDINEESDEASDKEGIEASEQLR